MMMPAMLGQTLHAAVGVLTEVLSLASPVAARRTARVRNRFRR
jgi:hypothetical protein